MEEEIINSITENISNKFDDIFLQGLSKKGYNFINKQQATLFVIENCFCAKSLETNQTTYYVKNEPFLLYVEKNEISVKDNPLSITGVMGYYYFL